MNEVDEYITGLDHSAKPLLEGLAAQVKQLVPNGEQGISYAMPAFFYRGKALLSLVVRKNHLSLYPFSGKVIQQLLPLLAGFECTSGSIHFTEQNPITDSILRAILDARMDEIDKKLDSRG